MNEENLQKSETCERPMTDIAQSLVTCHCSNNDIKSRFLLLLAFLFVLEVLLLTYQILLLHTYFSVKAHNKVAAYKVLW
jgi:hypothetical protein